MRMNMNMLFHSLLEQLLLMVMFGLLGELREQMIQMHSEALHIDQIESLKFLITEMMLTCYLRKHASDSPSTVIQL